MHLFGVEPTLALRSFAYRGHSSAGGSVLAPGMFLAGSCLPLLFAAGSVFGFSLSAADSISVVLFLVVAAFLILYLIKVAQQL